jgi:hypothetical protein
MSEHGSERSSFEKNLRSLMEALGMLEREASLLLDRFGFESESITRLLDMLGAMSADAVRPLASALGIADASTVEALARDVRALLQSDARVRREQAASAARVEELVSAIEALGTTTATLADLQARTAERLETLSDVAAAMAGTDEQRTRVLEDVERLRKRIDDLEAKLATEMGLGLGGEAEAGEDSGVRPAGTRRISRVVKPAATGSHKILEGLPTLEPKIRPA